MEQDPVVRLQYNEGEFLARRDNSHLYTFFGRLALYNHTFHYEVEGDEVQQSFYIFQSVDPEGFGELATYMVENAYPAHLNLQEIHNSDIQAHERATFKKLEREFNENGLDEAHGLE